MRSNRPILLKDATIFTGEGTTPLRGDVLIEGTFAHYAPLIELPSGGDEVIMDGLCVSPGWIDLHTHVYEDYGIFSVDPADIGRFAGVTTLVDAGSAGALNYASFAKNVIEPARETILSYVNIAAVGIVHGHAGRSEFIADHIHRSLHSVALAKALLGEFGDSIVGWKARLSAVLANNDSELESHAFQQLLALRDETGLPVMVHHVLSSISSDRLLESLLKRDVYTHLYHGVESSIFDTEGRPSDAALKARQRGVIFDVGHGSGSFRWDCAEKACQKHNFWPDTISSDLHRYNQFSPVRDLATTMSKFLHLGANPESVIAMVTGQTGRALDREIGILSAVPHTRPADLTIFEIESGLYPLIDSEGISREVSSRFIPLATIRGHDLSPCSGFFNRRDTSDLFSRTLQTAAAH